MKVRTLREMWGEMGDTFSEGIAPMSVLRAPPKVKTSPSANYVHFRVRKTITRVSDILVANRKAVMKDKKKVLVTSG